MRKSTLTLLLAGVGLCVGALPAGRASADECTDKTCPEGWTCELVAAPCIEPAPRSGPDGTSAAGAADSQCESVEVPSCVPPPPEECDPAGEDACSGDNVCVAFEVTTCEGGSDASSAVDPNAEGQSGSEPTSVSEPSCTSETKGICVPPYFAPCKADSDCGSDGFECVDEEACSCSAGAGAGAAGSTGGGVEPTEPNQGGDQAGVGGQDEQSLPPPDCTCEKTGDKYCQLKEVRCQVNSDCAKGLICQLAPQAITCTMDSGGQSDCTAGGPEQSYCAPEDVGGWAVAGELFAQADSVSSSGSTTAAPYDDFVRRAITGSANESTSVTAVKLAAPAAQGGGATAGGDEGGKSDAGGCRVGTEASTGSLAWSVLLAALFFARRRRR